MKKIIEMFSIKGKVAVITGATQGIGRAIAECFAQSGAKLVVCSRKQAAVDETVEFLKQKGAEVIGLSINVSSAKDRENLITKTIEWAGRIDILVNNAGANPKFGGLETLSEAEFDKVINVNLKATLFLSQIAYGLWMKDHGGVILNISSIGGLHCSTGINGYNVIKAALNHMTRCMASEWGKNGIRVNALAPGLIKTDFSQALWSNPKFQKDIEAQPVPRIGEVEDMAGAALYMVSEASGFMTGHTMILDGGKLIQN